jgi:amino acid transporter
MSSLLHTVKAVAWSFLGIRKNSEYQNDLSRLNPLHIVAVALVGVLLLVLGLVALVHWVVR